MATKMKLLGLVLLVLINIDVIKSQLDIDISNGLNNLINSTNAASWDDLSDAIRHFHGITNKTLADQTFCQTCKVVFHQTILRRKFGANKETMSKFFNKLCELFTDWGPTACTGYINIELDTVLYIIDNRKDLTADRVCAIVFQQHNCKDPNSDQWTIPLPPKRHHKNPQANKGVQPLKVLHLTDFHYDPLYKPGSNADCGVPLCCQECNGPPSDPLKAAGYWGDYHVCDTPWHSITNFMDYLTEKHELFDLVYYTGDIISHKSWATTKDHNVDSIKAIFKLFKDTFKETPVYPILGNHEPHPTDFYSPGAVQNLSVSTQWVFDLMAAEWSRWLPEDTKATISTGGFYTVLIRPGFRIIALNSNVCFLSNLWLIYDDVDPYGQLRWLIDILTQAEKDGEIVHILSHIPPGSAECLQRWSYHFRRIVERFAPIIAAQFNGHTHLDELRLFLGGANSSKVVNVAFNAGSFTTFVGFNPNYRIYDVDANTLTVLDYNHYTFNLTKANEAGNKTTYPDWYRLYSFKEAYGLNSTSLLDLATLPKKLHEEKALLQQYFRFQVRESDAAMANGCNDTCLQELLCSITAVEAVEAIKCQQ